MKKIVGLLAAVVSFSMLHSCTEPKGNVLTLQIQTQTGTIEGIEEDGIKKFLGIPFATPPVGELRWQAPQPAAPWDGVLETKAFGNDPMQIDIWGDMNFRGPKRSEDCLYLNVWTGAQRTDEGLPVLIYFNGGGWMAGSGSEPRYDGTALAQNGVIGVTANYREGIFGFLAHEELTKESSYQGSGNYGLLDQVAAIQWVKDNIAAFGGDPNRINIVGESAGSFSVSLLMCSPLSKNDLAGVIGSSGAEVLPYDALSQTEADEMGKATLQRVGLHSIAEARALDADSLQALLPPSGMSTVVIDGYFMKESANEVFKKNQQSQVPMMAGWNSLEDSPLSALRGQEPTLANYKNAMKAKFGDMTEDIFAAYGLLTDEDLFSQKSLNLAGDLFTGFCTWKWCDYHANISGQPVYRYKYNHPRPKVTAKMEEMTAALAGGVREKTDEDRKREEIQAKMPSGATHSSDIEYAMGALATNEYFDWQEEDYAISKTFLSFYVNFCKTGNPNGLAIDGTPLPTWTSITGTDVAPVMQIDVESKEIADAALENAYHTLEKFYLNQK